MRNVLKLFWITRIDKASVVWQYGNSRLFSRYVSIVDNLAMELQIAQLPLRIKIWALEYVTGVAPQSMK